ncbi:MAG: hypothetical protein NTV59_07015 [Chloroflexi bacterium]|nr:hypothetical protein [Chloroflexota bacterium]
MNDKNIRAAFITFLIALFIAWFAVGHTAEHIWSSWLFVVLFLVVIAALTIMLITRLQSETFDWFMLFEAAGIIIFGLFANAEVSTLHDVYKAHTWFNGIRILSYIIDGGFAFFFLFLVVRYVQHEAE